MKSLLFKSVEAAVKAINEDTSVGYVLHVPIQMIEALASQSHDQVILISTSGEYSSEGFKSGVITGFSYDLAIGQVVEIKDPPILSKNELESAYNQVKSNQNAFMLLFLDGLSGGEESVMSTLFFVDKKFKIIGGSSGDDLKFEQTHIYQGTKRIKHVAIFFNTKTRTTIMKENIYAPVGDKLLITDADPIKRIVYTINNKPAVTEYARVLGVSESDLVNHFMNHPLGKIYHDDILIASPMVINADKSITFYCQMMPNTFVYLLEPVDPVQKVNETMNQLNFRPSFMYVINCILRSLKFQEDHTWPSVDGCITGRCKNTTGFISYGEQFYKHHVNQTMVVLAVE